MTIQREREREGEICLVDVHEFYIRACVTRADEVLLKVLLKSSTIELSYFCQDSKSYCK